MLYDIGANSLLLMCRILRPGGHEDGRDRPGRAVESGGIGASLNELENLKAHGWIQLEIGGYASVSTKKKAP